MGAAFNTSQEESATLNMQRSKRFTVSGSPNTPRCGNFCLSTPPHEHDVWAGSSSPEDTNIPPHARSARVSSRRRAKGCESLLAEVFFLEETAGLGWCLDTYTAPTRPDDRRSTLRHRSVWTHGRICSYLRSTDLAETWTESQWAPDVFRQITPPSQMEAASSPL